MARLEPPYELLDLEDGEAVDFVILRYLEGEVPIVPRHAPAGKEVPAIRVWVSPEDKPVGAPYWDITAGNLIARLKPVLGELVRTGRRIRVIKHGIAPAARHEVRFL